MTWLYAWKRLDADQGYFIKESTEWNTIINVVWSNNILILYVAFIVAAYGPHIFISLGICLHHLLHDTLQ